MENLGFEEDIQMTHQDEDEDYDYRTPDTSGIGKASFIEPDASEATSTLCLRQKLKQDKLAALYYRHLNVTGNPDLIDFDRFRLTKDPKKGVAIFEFYNGDRLVPLTKQTGEFYVPKTIRDAFGGVKVMKNVLGIETTPPSLKQSVSAASKLKAELPTDLLMDSIPLEDLSSLAKVIHIKTREASQNTDLDMREFLDIDKACKTYKVS